MNNSVYNGKQNEKKTRNMESLTELYRIGRGPSSSHTIAPERACKWLLEKYPDADEFEFVLYNSFAKTGKGHNTDTVIRKSLLGKKVEISYNYSDTSIIHPNTMDVFVYNKKRRISTHRIVSVGGGKFQIDGNDVNLVRKPYELTKFAQINDYCDKNNLRLWQYVEIVEGKEIRKYMSQIWDQMKNTILCGLNDEGILPGCLNVAKKAKSLYNATHIDEEPTTRENRLISAYAFAVGEQNASGETVVTAPTCGASGVLPSVLFYYQQKRGYSDEQIISSLETAGIIGNLIKTNASISGAECGCQAEIGSACAMAAAALGELFGLEISKIEYASEISLEHHLGLTCDPVCGLVQIPCIERNAVAAMRAVNSINIANFLSDTRKISFDKVVSVMKKTGNDLSPQYRETAEAGLALLNL